MSLAVTVEDGVEEGIVQPNRGVGVGLGLARASLLVSVAAAGLTLAYVANHYDRLPERVPIHFGAGGAPDGWARRSAASVFLLPLLNLAIGPFTTLIAYWAAKSSVETPGPETAERDRLTTVLVVYLCGVALLTTAMLTLGSVGAVRVALGRAARLPDAFLWTALAMGVFVVLGAVYLLVLSFLMNPSPMAADPHKWRWGIFYFDPDNPAFVVARRWGWGYTLNFGHAKARVAVVVFVLCVFGVLAMAILAVSTG